jgi:hypothetical protein
MREDLSAIYAHQAGLLVQTIGAAVVALTGPLESLNPGNYRVLFEDVSLAVAPAAAAIAVALAARRGEPAHRAFRTALAVSLALEAAGQLASDIPDVTHVAVAALRTFSDGCNVLGALLGTTSLVVALGRRVPRDARHAVLLEPTRRGRPWSRAWLISPRTRAAL